jgi:hypothetical protein
MDRLHAAIQTHDSNARARFGDDDGDNTKSSDFKLTRGCYPCVIPYSIIPQVLSFVSTVNSTGPEKDK